MMQARQVTLFLVDDEAEVTTAMTWLLESMKFDVRAFNSTGAFLRYFSAHEGPACLIMDLLMPEQCGMDVLEVVMKIRPDVPTVFLSAHGDIPSAVRSMKLGAIDFLQKPFDPQNFLDVVNRGIRVARDRYKNFENIQASNNVFSELSAREQQVLTHTVSGKSSKEVAIVLGISYKTVEVHRASILRKLEVSTFKELIGRLRELKECGEAEIGWQCRAICPAAQLTSA